jgi:hypothetical protein
MNWRPGGSGAPLRVGGDYRQAQTLQAGGWGIVSGRVLAGRSDRRTLDRLARVIPDPHQ